MFDDRIHSTCKTRKIMEILQSFVLEGTSYEVKVHWYEDEPFFRGMDIGIILGIRAIRNTLLSFDDDEKVCAHTICANSDRDDIIYLTEVGLYRMLMISRKPIARPFQKWVTQVIKQIRQNGRYELQKYMEQVENEKEQFTLVIQAEAQKYKEQAKQSLHHSLVEAFANKLIVYMGIVGVKDDRQIVKVGSTKSIRERAHGLKNDFGSFELIKCIEIGLAHEEFEQFLLHHKDIRKYAYDDQMDNGKRSIETFLVSHEELQLIINIALRNAYKFRNKSTSENVLEIEQIRLEQLKVLQQMGINKAEEKQTLSA